MVGDEGAASAVKDGHRPADDGVGVFGGHVVGAHDGEGLAVGNVLDLAGGDDGASVGAGAQVLGAGAAIGGVGEDHFGGLVVGDVQRAAHVGAFADSGGQGAVVGALGGLQQVHVH